ncbi:MAG: phosphatase PAP2 family protein [Campylobacteraceae bacterium]|jgi:hypothetical protein|nr:phosphatase PAP2 family protein [Campylobacteraceae bacterium]
MSKFIKLFTIAAIWSYSYAKSGVEEVGDYMQVVVPVYAFGMAMNEKDLEGVKQFAYSFAAMEASVYGLKGIVSEERPHSNNKNAFPSGHTASAFSGATFIHQRYGFKKAVIPYLMAGFTGYSRIEADKHRFPDVVAGAVISSLMTWIFISEYDTAVQVDIRPDGVKFGFMVEF